MYQEDVLVEDTVMRQRDELGEPPQRSGEEARQEFVAYIKELNTRRNTLTEILQMRVSSWVIIWGAISVLLFQLVGAETLYYTIPLAIVWLVLVFLFELYRNQKRPLP